MTPIFMDIEAELKEMGKPHGKHPFAGGFGQGFKACHWMNTPGTIYCGATDNCGTGPDDAPDNVLLDAQSYQVIYKQPSSIYELEMVIDAAEDDPFGGYGADGNLHWNYKNIKEWWNNRGKLIEEVSKLHKIHARGNESHMSVFTSWQDIDASFYESSELLYWRWLCYIAQGMYEYLQQYAFFLDNGKIASVSDILPTF